MKYIIILLSLLYLINISDWNYESSNTYDADEIDIISLGPPNYQLYEYMKIYSEEYDIPFEYAMRCAEEETGYRGKFHFTYKPFEDRLRRSYADAYGPLQVQVPTANDMWDEREITADDLGYNIEVNVISSFRYQRYLYNIYKDWLKVYSIYNMGWKGKDNINQYAINIVKGEADV